MTCFERRCLEAEPNKFTCRQQPSTHKSEEANALGAGAAAAEEADGDDEAADADEDEWDLVDDEDRAGGVVAQQGGVEERFLVDVYPDAETEQRPPG